MMKRRHIFCFTAEEFRNSLVEHNNIVECHFNYEMQLGVIIIDKEVEEMAKEGLNLYRN